MKALWDGLCAWDDRSDEELTWWSKTTPFFQLRLSKKDALRYEIIVADDGGEEHLLTLVEADSLEDAQRQADAAGAEFLRLGTEVLKPETAELRFIQVALSGDTLVGLTSDGRLYELKQDKRHWIPLPMMAKR